MIEYGNVIIQPVANVANNTLGIKFADGTFQHTAANGGGGGSSTIAVQEEGTNVVASANTINFVGNGVTASNVSGVATITIPGASGIAVQEEGTNVLSTANTINFIGSGVTASNIGNVATITITSGGISGVAVQEEGTNVLSTANTINFVGNGVTASNVGGVATITINGAGNTTPGGSNTQLQFNDAGSFGGISLVTYSNIANGRYLNVSGNATTNAAVYYTYANASNIAVTGISTQEGNAFVSGWSGSTGSKIAIYPGSAGNIELALGNSAGRILMGDVGTIEITGGSNGQVLTTNGSGNLSWTTVSGSGGSGLPGYLRTYTGNVTISNGSNVYLWYPLLLDDTSIINTISASDDANGLITLQSGTYLFETSVPITNTGSDSIINVYTAFVENTPANGLTPFDGPFNPSNAVPILALSLIHI